MKALKYLIVLGMGLAIGTGDVLAARTIGKIIRLSGEASAQAQDGPLRKLSLNSPVKLNDTITTNAKGKLQILFDDGSTIQQGPASVMVINAYVYNAESAKDNQADFKVKKGLFRMITDKITRLNPKRFKVHSNYGTIGIRGCDLVFDIQPDQEKVTVIGLHHADSIVIDVDIEKGPGGAPIQDRKVITKEGIQVQMSAVAGVQVHRIDRKALEAMTEALAPDKVEKPTKHQVRGQPPDIGVEMSAAVRSSRVNPAALATFLASMDPPDPVIPEGIRPDPEISLKPPPHPPSPEAVPSVARSPSEAAPEPEAPPVPDPEASPVPDPDSPADPDPGAPDDAPPPGSRVETIEGGGTDWSWGSWARTSTADDDDDEDDDDFPITERGTFVRGQTIIGHPYHEIRDGAVQHNLTGNGLAGAAVMAGNQSTLLKGSLALNVLVGGGIEPAWDGTFNLSGVDGSLSFRSSGGIDRNGKLNGSIDDYSLYVFGQSRGSPDSSMIKGNLVGSGTGTRPITGAIGEFQFRHANNTKVEGVFGADLNNR
ncbi:MAG: FecR family protein [Verrucomicrobiota bacterium]